MASLQTIARFTDLPLAELARAKLEAEGIPCFLANKNLIGVNWLYSNVLGGVEVQVPAEQAEQAKELLEADHSADLAALEAQFSEAQSCECCPRCGSSDIGLVKLNRKAGALSLLLGLPLIFFGKRYRCKQCRLQFRPGTRRR